MTFAPIDAEYLTLAANGVLTDYRILTLGGMLVAVDGGPASPYTLDVDPTAVPHNSLDQLTTGNPHTQYLLGTILAANGDLLTRVAGSPAALAIGSSGDVLTVSGGLPAWAAPASGYALLDSQPTELLIVNTAAATDLYTFQIPANTLASADLLRLRLLCDYLNNSGAAKTFTVELALGGTTIWQDTTQSTVSSNAARHTLEIDFELAIRNANPNVRGQGLIWLGATAAPTTGLGQMASTIVQQAFATGDANLTLSNNLQLQVIFTHSAAHANTEVRRRGATLEHISP